jgi:hypothetical protein
MNPTLIKPVLIVITSLFILFMLSGCVVAPYEPVVYAAPPPPAAVVVRPAYGHHYHHGHRWQGRRGWR